MTHKAIIFDLDGTLLDSLGGIAGAMNSLLESLNYPTFPVEDYKYFVGGGLEEAFNHTFPEGELQRYSLEDLFADYRARYNNIWPDSTRPYQGIVPLLETLGQERIPFSILSNKSQSFTERMVEVLLPGFPFFKVWGQRPGVPLKPDPTAALEMAHIQGLEPAEYLFVGDSGIDMRTGRNAGMTSVGVLWGFRDAPELLTDGAHHLISTPEELLEVF